eukprot:jgi/Mesvir1/14606/Mv05276-RA.1
MDRAAWAVFVVLMLAALGAGGYFGRRWWDSRDDQVAAPPPPPLASASTAPAAAGDEEQVRFWVDQVTAKAKQDGDMEMPSPQEVALRMQLQECTDSAPCGDRVLGVMGRIAEGVLEKIRR